MAALIANTAAAPQVLLNGIMMDIDRFAAGMPQHDDITLMLLKAS